MQEQGPYSLLAALAQVKDKQRPPIHLWNPDNVKDIDMEVKANGDWYYLGTPIQRQRLVHLFASVLRHEDDGEYYLVTPVEKCRIKVADVPFLAVLMTVANEGKKQRLTFTTNMAEELLLGADHALRFEFDPATEEPSPYLHVRDNLEARLSRSVYYQLAELLQANTVEDVEWLGIWSDSIFFPVIRKLELG
ncbi:MAG: DUF1285 domain-containing protein [bacterium]|nr:DUF1285 domain-containing protein [Gammaproteobacteria bacterium]HIL94483.1 DUF1285 domain-containing protein [Pseudomonadales bacterium]